MRACGEEKQQMLVYQWSLCPGKPLGSPRCAPPVGHARLISPLGSQPSIAVLLTPDLAPGEVSWKMGQGRGGEGDDNEDAGGRTQVSSASGLVPKRPRQTLVHNLGVGTLF